MTKVFDGTVKALDGVDLGDWGGRAFFLLGGSGCGKTTLLRCIAGLEKPTSGRIYFGDNDVTAMAPHKPGGGDGFPKLRVVATFDSWAEYRLWS